MVEKPVERVVEKIVEVPIEVPTTIEVPVYRDRIVEKIVEKPVENTAALKELSDEVARLLAELERVKSEQASPVIVDPVLPAMVRPNVQDSIKATSDFDLDSIGTTSFGTTWPANPARGDLFLKVDTKPNRLYKWNNRKWIEIDRGRVGDTLAYDPAYIDHLIQEIRKGHQEYDDLTEVEQQQIIARIRDTGIES